MSAATPARPLLRVGLLLCIAAQLITISALNGADPIPATWAAMLLGIAPVPVALLAALAPPRVALPTVSVAGLLLVAGIAGTITHTRVIFIPALIVLAAAAAPLWRDQAR